MDSWCRRPSEDAISSGWSQHVVNDDPPERLIDFDFEVKLLVRD
jgi:hypothetical protein